jgi:hypothetical protein
LLAQTCFVLCTCVKPSTPNMALLRCSVCVQDSVSKKLTASLSLYIVRQRIDFVATRHIHGVFVVTFHLALPWFAHVICCGRGHTSKWWLYITMVGPAITNLSVWMGMGPHTCYRTEC